MAILDLNNTQHIYNRTPKRDFTQAYNEMLQANQVLNNPNLGGASFTPKKSLVDIYNQASAKNTPTWAMALSNAMPSIGEIVANATIKNGFQQRPVAESLERQKQRQQAYNQWLQENEQNQAKDFVQIAKEQLGMDIADDERKYNRNMAQLNRDDRLNAQKQAYQQWLDEFNLKQDIADLNKQKIQEEINALKYANSPEGKKAKAEADELDRRKKIAEVTKAERENNPEYIAQKEQEAQRKEALAEVNKLIEKKMLNAYDSAFLLSHPEAYTEIKSRVPFSILRGKYKIPQEIINKYEKEGKGDTYGIFSLDDNYNVNTNTGTFRG